MQNLTLFHKETCPYCIKVTKYMAENHITVKMVDIDADPRHREELKDIGGKVQVPMLLIDDQPLYESDDIIEWFKNNK